MKNYYYKNKETILQKLKAKRLKESYSIKQKKKVYQAEYYKNHKHLTQNKTNDLKVFIEQKIIVINFN